MLLALLGWAAAFAASASASGRKKISRFGMVCFRHRHQQQAACQQVTSWCFALVGLTDAAQHTRLTVEPT
jgi:hypothetical protein